MREDLGTSPLLEKREKWGTLEMSFDASDPLRRRHGPPADAVWPGELSSAAEGVVGERAAGSCGIGERRKPVQRIVGVSGRDGLRVNH